MKLSEMNTDQLADVMVELTEPVANLMEDAEIAQAVESAMGLHMLQGMGRILRKLVPVALKNKREDTLRIIAVLSGKTVEALHQQKGMQTIADAYNVWDDDLMVFFKQHGNMA